VSAELVIGIAIIIFDGIAMCDGIAVFDIWAQPVIAKDDDALNISERLMSAARKRQRFRFASIRIR
jgi:hypothetical protein